jgi:uncharacterized membrane protein YeiH
MTTTDNRLLRALDLVGSFVLAIQGASIAAEAGLDVFGVLVVSLVSATGGGIVRDILIGEHPPEALRGWPIVTASLLGGCLTILFYHFVEQIPEQALLVVDALGLSLLAVAGTEKALETEMTPIAAIMMGAISGVGGSILRDILLMHLPSVLRTDFIATAAIAGATVLVIVRKVLADPRWAAGLGGLTCCVLRLVALWQHWKLPTVSLH